MFLANFILLVPSKHLLFADLLSYHLADFYNAIIKTLYETIDILNNNFFIEGI